MTDTESHSNNIVYISIQLKQTVNLKSKLWTSIFSSLYDAETFVIVTLCKFLHCCC